MLGNQKFILLALLLAFAVSARYIKLPQRLARFKDCEEECFDDVQPKAGKCVFAQALAQSDVTPEVKGGEDFKMDTSKGYKIMDCDADAAAGGDCEEDEEEEDACPEEEEEDCAVEEEEEDCEVEEEDACAEEEEEDECRFKQCEEECFDDVQPKAGCKVFAQALAQSDVTPEVKGGEDFKMDTSKGYKIMDCDADAAAGDDCEDDEEDEEDACEEEEEEDQCRFAQVDCDEDEEDLEDLVCRDGKPQLDEVNQRCHVGMMSPCKTIEYPPGKCVRQSECFEDQKCPKCRRVPKEKEC